MKGPAQRGLNELAEVGRIVLPNCVQDLLQYPGAVLEPEEHPGDLGTLGDSSTVIMSNK